MENDIIQIVCRHLGVDRAQVLGKSRQWHVSEARQIAMYFIRRYSSYSFSAVGRIFGRNHTAALLGCKSVRGLREVDAVFRKKVEDIELSVEKTKKARNMVMVVSEEFNRGYWCAVQEFSAQGVSDSLIEAVILSSGLTYDECIGLIDESDFERERLEPIVEHLLKDK
jgi:hypothetical protein